MWDLPLPSQPGWLVLRGERRNGYSGVVAREESWPLPARVAVLMCHAPIVIPVIGGDRAAECAATTAAMQAAAEAVVRCGAETAVVLSPHTPRHTQAFGYVGGKTAGRLPRLRHTWTLQPSSGRMSPPPPPWPVRRKKPGSP